MNKRRGGKKTSWLDALVINAVAIFPFLAPASSSRRSAATNAASSAAGSSIMSKMTNGQGDATAKGKSIRSVSTTLPLGGVKVADAPPPDSTAGPAEPEGGMPVRQASSASLK
eukprot:gene12296-8794_t